jgi:hypothetical protein
MGGVEKGWEEGEVGGAQLCETGKARAALVEMATGKGGPASHHPVPAASYPLLAKDARNGAPHF